MSRALTLVITRDVNSRYRGFLRSAMAEIASGIYVSTQLNSDARDRLYEVIREWHETLNSGSITMIWRDKDAAADIGIRCLGTTQKDFCDVDGFLLTRKKK